MPEAPLPDPSSDVPASELSDAEWTDESGGEEAMPAAAPPLKVESTTRAQENADVADAEWTDESGFQDSVPVPEPPPLEAQVATDVWDAGTSDWLEDSTDLPLETAVPTTQEALAWLKPLGRRSRTAWQQLLRGIRSRIPAAANLSDGILSSLLIGILVLLLTLINGVRQPTGAAPSPVSEPVSSPELPAIPEVETPTSLPAAPTLPDAANSPLDSAAAALQSDRIANLQAQLTDSTILNAKRVIDSVQADFTANRLTLMVNGDWYRLSDYDQTQLAQQLMTQSVNLAFERLELQTATGELIARTPVIGDEMVIFLRSAPPVVEPPPRPRYRLTVDR